MTDPLQQRIGQAAREWEHEAHGVTQTQPLTPHRNTEAALSSPARGDVTTRLNGPYASLAWLRQRPTPKSIMHVTDGAGGLWLNLDGRDIPLEGQSTQDWNDRHVVLVSREGADLGRSLDGDQTFMKLTATLLMCAVTMRLISADGLYVSLVLCAALLAIGLSVTWGQRQLTGLSDLTRSSRIGERLIILMATLGLLAVTFVTHMINPTLTEGAVLILAPALSTLPLIRLHQLRRSPALQRVHDLQASSSEEATQLAREARARLGNTGPLTELFTQAERAAQEQGQPRTPATPAEVTPLTQAWAQLEALSAAAPSGDSRDHWRLRSAPERAREQTRGLSDAGTLTVLGFALDEARELTDALTLDAEASRVDSARRYYKEEA